MQDVFDHIQAAYGSLDKPNFSFRKQQYDARPYDELITSVIRELGVTAEEYTDINDDSCFGYTLSGDGGTWILELSMVGPFVVFSRFTENGRRILSADDRDLTPGEQGIMDLLAGSKLRLMRRKELEQPVDLQLFNTVPENVRLYQVLFSDIDILPWSFSEDPDG